MRFPVDKPYRITTKYSAGHRGIDIAPLIPGQQGKPVRAPEDAYVVVYGNRPSLEGKYVILKGKESKRYFYFGHFDSVLVRTGNNIPEGKVLGYMGDTGLTTGIHTHHEIRSHRNRLEGGLKYKTFEPITFYKENDMYKGKTAKQWYDEHLKYKKWWLFRREQAEKFKKALTDIYNRAKGVLGK